MTKNISCCELLNFYDLWARNVEMAMLQRVLCFFCITLYNNWQCLQSFVSNIVMRVIFISLQQSYSRHMLAVKLVYISALSAASLLVFWLYWWPVTNTAYNQRNRNKIQMEWQMRWWARTMWTHWGAVFTSVRKHCSWWASGKGHSFCEEIPIFICSTLRNWWGGVVALVIS